MNEWTNVSMRVWMPCDAFAQQTTQIQCALHSGKVGDVPGLFVLFHFIFLLNIVCIFRLLVGGLRGFFICSDHTCKGERCSLRSHNVVSSL